MSKEEFLHILDRKLQVINERERKDIIDEYRTHIEMKMQEGKTEEEAIEDFGDIDELVNEILDAYKINTDSVNNSFDRKFNHFMDEAFDGFKRFLGSFTSMDVDDVVRLIFEILIILVLLMVLRIPFHLVSALGYELLHSLIGFGVGSILGHLWELIINIAYIVIFIVVLVNLIGKRVERYRHHDSNGKTVFDDFKDSMQNMSNKKHASETIYDAADDQATQEEAEYKQEQAQYRKGNPYTSSQDYEHTSYDERNSATHGVVSVVSIFMKIFFCLLLIPFIGIIIALCCALGAMAVLSMEGLTLFGAYFIVIGGIIVTGAFLSAIHRVLWRRG